MAILSGNEIYSHHVAPFKLEARQPASYDVRLGKFAKCYDQTALDLRNSKTLETTEIEIPKDGIYLQPGILWLGTTEEYITCQKFAVQIVALSSLMRVGLQVGQGSWADPGFHGHLTLELSVMSRHHVKIYPGMRIAQLVFHRVEGEIEMYKGRYQGQAGAQGALEGI